MGIWMIFNPLTCFSRGGHLIAFNAMEIIFQRLIVNTWNVSEVEFNLHAGIDFWAIKLRDYRNIFRKEI